MVIFTGYSPSSQLNIKHMYALAFSRTCDTVFFACSSLNHDKFMFKVPFWNHTSGGACPKTPYIQGNQDKRFSVSAFSYTHRFNNLFIYGINWKKFARFFTSTRGEADNRHNFFVICWIMFHFTRFFQHSSRLECVIYFVMKFSGLLIRLLSWIKTFPSADIGISNHSLLKGGTRKNNT